MDDLLNSTFIKSARENMSQEQLDLYARIGEQFYDNFDVDTGTSSFDPIAQVAEEITANIRSGLHPTYLTEDEKGVLCSLYGEEWYVQFGFEKQDLDEIRV